MPSSHSASTSDLHIKLKWLMLSRLLFTSLLLGSTILLHLSEAVSSTAPALMVLYGLIAAIFILTFLYSVALKYVGYILRFAYLQIGIDTLTVSLLIFVTGNYSSIFSFLYLVVIIYSCMLLQRTVLDTTQRGHGDAPLSVQKHTRVDDHDKVKKRKNARIVAGHKY